MANKDKPKAPFERIIFYVTYGYSRGPTRDRPDDNGLCAQFPSISRGVGTRSSSGAGRPDRWPNQLATLAALGIFRPLKMLPILLLEIFYKVLWLIIVAYPLWSADTLVGSSAEGTTSAFLWVILPIVAVPWGYVFQNYIYTPKK
jgi:hypothetical protein